MKKIFVVLILVFLFFSVLAESNSTNYIVVTEGVTSGGGEIESGNYITSVVSDDVSGESNSTNYISQLGVLYGLNESGENEPPTISIISPNDGNVTTNRTPTFSYIGSDPNGDSLVYDINMSKKGASICADYNLDVTDYLYENYTFSKDLNCLSDNGDYYEWSVRACENDTTELYCSNWTTVRTINITSLVQISLPVDSIQFGSMSIGESKNTTNASLNPLSLRNDGNCKVNVSMNATNIWTSISQDISEYFQSKVVSFVGNASWANTSWFGIPTITGFATIASDLNYSEGSDMLDIDMLVKVPSGESPGTKSSTVNIRAELSEIYGAS